jgi:hypothetical protein
MNFDDDEEEEYEKLPVSKDVTRKASIKKKMSTFDDDDDEEEDEPVVSTNVKRKIQTKKKIATFDDDDEEPTVSKDVTKKITTSDDGNIDSIHLLNMSRTGYACLSLIEEFLNGSQTDKSVVNKSTHTVSSV